MTSFETHVRTVTLLTLASRATGLLRDAALGRVFGAGPLMSAFFFAFMIPNLFRRLFGEGALAAAFLPAYTRLIETDQRQAAALASLTVSKLTIWLGVVTIAAEILLFVLSSRGEELNLSLWLTMIMLPYMPLVCLVAILGAMLQVHGRFGPTAAAPIVLNVCIIAATLGLLYVFDPDEPRERLAHAGLIGASVIFAGLIQVAWSLISLRSRHWWTREQHSARADFRNVVRLAGPMILSLGVLQMNTFIDGLIASYPVTLDTDSIFGFTYPLDRSAMAVLSFAQRLYQFPLGVFGIAVATAIFPLLSRQANDEAAFADTLRRGLRLVVFIGLPASVGLILVRDPLTAVIYEGGEFDRGQTERVGFVLLGYAPAIWAYSMTHTLTRAFYALGDSIRPMRVALGVVGLNLVLNLILIWYLREAGLAWSTAICAMIQVIALLALIRRHVSRVIDREVVRSWVGSVAVTVFMAVAVAITAGFFDAATATWSARLIELIVLTGLGLIVVAITSVVLRMPELKWALGGGARPVTEERQ